MRNIAFITVDMTRNPVEEMKNGENFGFFYSKNMANFEAFH